MEEEVVFYGDMTREAGVESMKKLLQLPVLPDGLFSSSDFSIIGAMDVLKKHHLPIPQTMALAGFSNETFTDVTEPRLTSVDQRCEQMGQAAVRLFLKILDDKSSHRFTPRHIVLQPELLIRESSLRLLPV